MQNTPVLTILELVLAILSAIVGSSGFWMWYVKRSEKRLRQDPASRLLMGLAHDRIIYLGMKYISRKSITRDEYENLIEYLYTPYLEIGGNGSANRIMDEVKTLPIRENIMTNTGSN